MKVLIIIPCYNEEKNIVETVKKIKQLNYDYIIINDGSKDNSLETIQNNKLKYLNQINNCGIGATMQTGYKYAKANNYDIAVQFDGDGQHNAEYIDNIIKPIIEDNIDLVIGSRFIGNESAFKSTKMRRLGITILSKLLKIFSKQDIKDMTSGFRAANKKTISNFAENYPYEYPEPVTNLSLAKANYNIKEIPVKMNERKYGVSSITKLKSVYYMINVILYFFIIGLGKRGDNNAY